MAEKEKTNFLIHLSGNKYLVGSSLCYWIASKSRKVDKNGNPVFQRLSGYHTDLESVIASYIRDAVRSADIEGEISDLMELIIKTHKEVKGWFRKAEKALKEMEK